MSYVCGLNNMNSSRNNITSSSSVSVEDLIRLYGSKASLRTTFSPSTVTEFISSGSIEGRYHSPDMNNILQDLVSTRFFGRVAGLLQLMRGDSRLGNISRALRSDEDSSGTPFTLGIQYISDRTDERIYVTSLDILQIDLNRITVRKGDDNKIILQCQLSSVSTRSEFINEDDVRQLESILNRF